MVENEDAPPFGVFRVVYSIATWSGVALMVAILVWLMVTMFTLAPAGTASSQRLQQVQPTMTALVALVPEPPPAEVTALPPQCAACHMVDGTGGSVGPELSEIGSIALERIDLPGYDGNATTAAEYIRESIAEPSAFIVPGFENAASPDTSIMPPYGGLPVLQTDSTYFDLLVEYLAGLE